MFDKDIFKKYLEEYKLALKGDRWEKENYKWFNIKHFNDNWDIDAENFKEMLSISLGKLGNLIQSGGKYSLERILLFAENSPEEVRAMYADLYDEKQELYKRIEKFKNKSEELNNKYSKYKQTFQDENTIMTYLWLRYPDKYYVYQFNPAFDVATKLKSNYKMKAAEYEKNINNFMKLYDEICVELSKDEELISIFRSKLNENYYPDPKLKTLTGDFAYFIHQKHKKIKNKKDIKETIDEDNKNNIILQTQTTNKNYWWLNANPKIWSFSNLAVGETINYTLYNDNGNKRRVFQNFLNAKLDDLVICYEGHPTKKVIGIAKVNKEQDGKEIYFEK